MDIFILVPAISPRSGGLPEKGNRNKRRKKGETYLFTASLCSTTQLPLQASISISETSTEHEVALVGTAGSLYAGRGHPHVPADFGDGWIVLAWHCEDLRCGGAEGREEGKRRKE